ncbi:Protein ZINC INDUCED FACILITATOR-LIKE 1 [Rhizoctonia solani]|uniref:Protein ZINC INDUCED FACILITATOR-LIKE 1 n=1 Tax=Rhizoctonia solani TaxID=456999 RepID=A0A0K6GJC4_9AGAM|nr:Protein ZINC INDUCED FACILITATOR-LIKE 1 [Rhizoctonia solani]
MSGEQQPLLEPAQGLQNDELADTASSSTLRQNEEEPKITPLPMKQISILLLMQLSEPISYSVIYPFVAQLVNETGVTGGDKSKIGYYAGMIESVFFLTESVITLQYGRISDRIGRRPVLMFGLLGQAVSIFLFGLSKQFWQLVASRSLSGALNGNVGVVKSMVVELTDETNQAQAFAFTPMVWSLGSTLGPLIGGTLSHPAKHLPRMFDHRNLIGRRPVLLFGMFGQALSIFSVGLSKKFWQLVFSRALSGALNGNLGVAKSMVVELTDETNQAQAFAFLPIVWSTGSTLGPFLGGTLSHPAKVLPSLFDTPFWNEYPYFLPCLVAAIYSSCVFIVGALFLKETHTTHAKHSCAEGSTENSAAPPYAPQPRRSVSIRSVLTRRARIAIANYAFLAFTDITYLGLLPIVFAVSIQDGGLGFDPRTIGLVLGLQGIVTGLVQVFFFAPLHRRLGSKKLYVTGFLCYCLLILSIPVMHTLAALEMRRTLWAILGLHVALSCPAFMAFSCVFIYVNSAAPSKDSLGTLNGISQTIISIIRAIGPATATSLFSLSVRKNTLGGNFVYAILLGMSCVGVYASQWLKEEKRAYE